MASLRPLEIPKRPRKDHVKRCLGVGLLIFVLLYISPFLLLLLGGADLYPEGVLTILLLLNIVRLRQLYNPFLY